MNPATPTRESLWTAEQLYELGDSGKFTELVRGEPIEVTPSNPRHSALALRVARALSDYVEQHDLGEVFGEAAGFQLAADPDTVRAPDVSFVKRDRLPAVEDQHKGFWKLAPDLAVEVVSPSERAGDLQQKIWDYVEAGVRLIWTIYPDTRTVQEYRGDRQGRLLREDDALDGGNVVPGVSLPISELFRKA